MISEEKLNETLDELGEQRESPPEIGEELQRQVEEARPAQTRSPMRELAILTVASLVYAAGLLVFLELRRDMELLPRLWMILYVGAWLASFLGIAYLAVVPRRGQIISRWWWAGIAAVGACVLFTTGGIFFARHVPGLSTMYQPSAERVLAYAPWCLEMGLATALVPVALAALFLRRAVAVGSRWIAAAIGAAGGSLGGLFLHLHCLIGERFHLGLVHGGVVVLGALLCAAILPLFLRP